MSHNWPVITMWENQYVNNAYLDVMMNSHFTICQIWKLENSLWAVEMRWEKGFSCVLDRALAWNDWEKECSMDWMKLMCLPGNKSLMWFVSCIWYDLIFVNITKSSTFLITYLIVTKLFIYFNTTDGEELLTNAEPKNSRKYSTN